MYADEGSGLAANGPDTYPASKNSDTGASASEHAGTAASEGAAACGPMTEAAPASAIDSRDDDLPGLAGDWVAGGGDGPCVECGEWKCRFDAANLEIVRLQRKVCMRVMPVCVCVCARARACMRANVHSHIWA